LPPHPTPPFPLLVTGNGTAAPPASPGLASLTTRYWKKQSTFINCRIFVTEKTKHFQQLSDTTLDSHINDTNITEIFYSFCRYGRNRLLWFFEVKRKTILRSIKTIIPIWYWALFVFRKSKT
jgi:hypothetical protein